MVQLFVTVVNGLSRALAFVATLLLVAAMVVVCQMIVVRYFLGAATIWQTDFVVFSATVAIFLGAPYVLLKGGHVGVDVVPLLLRPRARRRLRVVAGLLGLVFCGAMLAASWMSFHEAYVAGWKHSSVWAPPLWVPMAGLPIGFAMLCLQYVAQILELLTTPPADEGLPGELAHLSAIVSDADEKEAVR